MTIAEQQEEVIAEFSLFDEWMDKYEHLIGLGKELPLIEEQHKTEDNLIKGCQSRVWLQAKLESDKVVFAADSDAIITKGIIALMVRVLSGHAPSEIVEAELYFIDQIGLKEHLSPTRSNGLVAMVKQMKWYALAFQAKTTS
jgi:cysteine desulfuration protein SufE